MSKRIAFFADRIAHWNAGTERQLLLLGTELSKRGWSVPLYVLRRSNAVTDGIWPGDVMSLDSARIASPLTWWRVFSVVRRERRLGTKITHCFFNDTSILVPPMSRIVGLSSIVSRRDMGFWYTRGILRALRMVRPSVSAVIANCHAVKDNVCEHEGYLPQSIEVIYNGNADTEHPQKKIDDDRLVIGIVANIRKIKRIPDAIRAFAAVSVDFPTAVLRVIGAGDASKLKRLAETLDVATRVEFAGRSENPATEIAGFSIAMLTSESEGLSNAIIECMLGGVPVICTNTGGNPELVTHNETGLLAKVGDVDGLATCLRRLLADDDVRNRMGDRAQQSIRVLCSTNRMIEAHIEAYVEVAA